MGRESHADRSPGTRNASTAEWNSSRTCCRERCKSKQEIERQGKQSPAQARCSRSENRCVFRNRGISSHCLPQHQSQSLARTISNRLHFLRFVSLSSSKKHVQAAKTTNLDPLCRLQRKQQKKQIDSRQKTLTLIELLNPAQFRTMHHRPRDARWNAWYGSFSRQFDQPPGPQRVPCPGFTAAKETGTGRERVPADCASHLCQARNSEKQVCVLTCRQSIDTRHHCGEVYRYFCCLVLFLTQPQTSKRRKHRDHFRLTAINVTCAWHSEAYGDITRTTSNVTYDTAISAKRLVPRVGHSR
ncbi:MAG: hypothetical protein JWM11_7511 [Planctomycetaceae bacterium]|nr:hypothetical protein [Planctomycetaceae bacterium]